MRFRERIQRAVGSSVKLKLTLFLLLILALTIGMAPWSAIRVQQNQLLEASEERLSAMHERLEGVLRASMLLGEPKSVQSMMEAAGAHRDVRTLRILNLVGEVRFSSDPEERGVQVPQAEMQRYVGKVHPLVVESGGEVVHTLVRPLFNEERCANCHNPHHKVLGVLQVSLSLERTWDQLASLRHSAIIATILTLGVVTVGIWLALTAMIDQPLNRLVAMMQRAKEGDLGVRAPVANNDEIGKLAGHFNDMISRLDTAQRELEQYHREQMARADRLATIGELAAAVAHEIRNPLTGIRGVLSVLSRDFPPEDPRRGVVKQTNELIDRLNKSVEDILYYSRPSRPHLQSATLRDVVNRAVSLVDTEARKSQIEMKEDASLDGDLGSQPIRVDAQQIQQVLVNLLLNSLQACAAGGHITVRATAGEEDGRVAIEVVDDGKGVSAEAADRVFEPFFSTKPHGTGLGLSIARQIIEQHKGAMSLSSAPGAGTCVRIELPTAPQDGKAEA
jgi:signal transduction histidine kinase